MEGPTLWGLAIAFAILFVAFRALELFRTRERRLPVLRKGFLIDGAYWLFTPFVTKAITRICVAGVAIPYALIAYGKVDRELISTASGPFPGCRCGPRPSASWSSAISSVIGCIAPFTEGGCGGFMPSTIPPSI
jgi:hypothetical protein